MLLTHRGRSAYFDQKSLAFGVSEDWNKNAVIDFSTISPVSELYPSKRLLERLVLNIANLCNLNCSYCYAQGGDYGGPHERMSHDTGILALEKFFHEYDEVCTIQFFGGEPFLNWMEMERLCKYIFELADRIGKARPTLMVSTNGTILNEDILRIIREYDLKVTVSIDGPPEITNLLRPSRNGKPTSETLEANIRRMRDETGQPSQVEGTYTDTHLALGYSVTDVLDYISDFSGVPLLHMPCNVLGSGAGMTENQKAAMRQAIIDGYCNAVIDAVDTLVNKPFGTKTILNSALELIDELVRPSKKERPVICPAGTGTIAIDSNGDIYPCFMFYRKKAFRFGSVKDGAVYHSDVQDSFVEKLRRTNTDQKFYHSWARRFFMGCAGGNFFKSEDHGVISDFEVELVESMASAVIVELSHLHQEQKDKVNALPLVLQLFKLFVNTPQLG